MTENEMVGWHHQLNGHEFEQTRVYFLLEGQLRGCVLLEDLDLLLLLLSHLDYNQAGSSVLVILKARILEWVAMPSSRGFSQPRD